MIITIHFSSVYSHQMCTPNEILGVEILLEEMLSCDEMLGKGFSYRIFSNERPLQ